MMNENAVTRFAEGATTDFTGKEIRLLTTESREIVQTIVNPRIVRFVLTAVQHDKAHVSPRESMVGCTAGAEVKQTEHTRRISITDFMVAAQENTGNIGTMERADQGLYGGKRLIAMSWFGQTVSVKNHEIMRYAISQPPHSLFQSTHTVHVVKDQSRKVCSRVGGQRKAVEIRALCPAKFFVIRLIFQNLLSANTIVISGTGLQIR